MVIDLILQALSSPFSVLILYLLDRYGEMKLYEILTHVGFSKYKAVRKTITLLAKAELVNVAIKKISPRVHAWRIKLTKRGKRIIRSLINSILE